MDNTNCCCVLVVTITSNNEGMTGNALGRRQHSKDVPPGWHLGVYPVAEYFE
jgi:hypothetical protein